ncbi:MAG: GFA family protein [Gammaproteobacteria bacterium]
MAECNCSICSRHGRLLWFVPRNKLRLQTPESDLAGCTFNSRRIKHHFCPACGCATFGEGADKPGAKLDAVNVRCLDGVDLASLRISHFDRQSL